MPDILRSYLSNLHGILSRNFNGRGTEASNIVQDIVSLCQDSISDSELAYCSSFLFNKDFGVLNFINATVPAKEFENVKADLLKFLAAYCDKIGNGAVQYAKYIKDTCVTVVNRDSSSKVKVESYNLLVQLLETRDKAIEEKLDIPTLVSKFFSFCLQSTKEVSSVRGALFHLLGVFAERFPEHMTEIADRLLSIYLGMLKQQMTVSKKPELQVIGGCLRGLNGYLVGFTQSEQDDPKNTSNIFRYIKMAIDPKNDLARYDVPKAGLSLLERHAAQFRISITDDYKYVYDVLCKWSQHSNKEMKVAGLKAMDSCLTQIASCIVERGKASSSMAILKDILTKCHKTLNSETSSSKELSLAIKGYGIFAEACKKLLTEADLKMMFQEILNRSQHVYSSIENLTDENLQHLPGFLEALASIIQQTSEVSEVYLLPIERIVIILFEQYPKLGKGGMFMYQKSLTHFIRALSANASVFKGCLSHIVYQGLIRTCSHPVVTEEGITDESISGQNERQLELSYRSFLDLWISLITEKNYREPCSLDGSTKSTILKDRVYDELIQSVLFIVQKLNLHTEKEKTEEKETIEVNEQSVTCSSDPLTGLIADVPKDFQIFINLVEFCRAIFPIYDVESFRRWIPVFTKEIMTLSSRYPLVSGFYKLLEISAQICAKLDYLKDISFETSELNERTVTFLLLKRYMTDTLGRIKQFKDDLLSSCLQFVLSLPVEVVEENIHLLSMPLQMTLQLGLSYHTLAVSALNALEHWSDRIPREKIKPLLHDVLPSLDRYLHVSSEKSGTVIDEQDAVILSQSSRGKRSRVPIKLLKALRDSTKTADSPLVQLRMRMVMFLGKLGGSLNIETIKDRRVPDLSRAVAWDNCNHLSFALPFKDMKPTIYLDCFLPRVVELSLTSSDRQTKVVACELLHALILFMLGKSTQQTSQNARLGGMEDLYKHVFPAVLKLGCDIEQVAEQLFRPLVFEMIHWFTSSPSKTESVDTMVLLDSILDGVVSTDNSALRDFSAKCLKEFLAWSIKQTSKRQLSKSAVNPKAVFKRIYSMASHPNVFKRLGAALAFNNIYTVFREHEELVDVYTLELLVEFINSLAIAHHDEAAVGTVEQGKEAADHLERIIKQKSILLFKKTKSRRVPKSLQRYQSDGLTLDHIFEWLLRQCGRPQTECRHECMELLFSLLPTRPEMPTARTWFENTIKSDGAKYLVDRFEGGGLGTSGSRMNPTICDVKSVFNVKDLVSWLERYLASLDCYTWITRANLVSPSQLLLDENSVALATVEYFVKELALNGLEATRIKCAKAGIIIPSNVLTPMDIQLYSRSKCTAVVRTLDFLTATLNSGMWRDAKLEASTSRIFVRELHDIILLCILQPEAVGFDVADITVLQNLPEAMQQLCLGMRKGLPPAHFNAFISSLTSVLGKERYDLIGHLPVDLGNTMLGNEKFSQLQQLTLGYELLNNTGLLKQALQPQAYKSLCAQLLSNVVNGLMPLSANEDAAIKPVQKRLADCMLQLALQLEMEPNMLTDVLLDPKPVKDQPGTWPLSPRGSVFYHIFKPTINEYILSRDGNIISLIIDQGISMPSLLSLLLQGILESCSKQKPKIAKRTRHQAVDQLLSKWTTLSCWWKASASMDMKIASLNILKHLLNVDAERTMKSVGLNASPPLSTFLILLSDSSTGLAFKGHLIELLPLVFNGLREDATAPVGDSLKRFIATSFPLSSADLLAGSSKYSEYMDCLNKFFKSLVMSATPALLEVLLTVIIKETDDIYNRTILPALTAYFKKLTVPMADKSLNICFSILLDDQKYPNSIRRGVLDRIFTPVFQHLPISNVRKFFKENIKVIMQRIETKLVKIPELAFENQLVTKICCFRLVQSLYTCLGKDDLVTKHSEIVKAYLSTAETGKELTQAITKAAHSAKCEDCRGETLLSELRREYHCAAYSCLCAVIASTQIELKFFTAFLFTDNLAKGQFLLDNILDLNKEFFFDSEQTVLFARKKQLQMIRRKTSPESKQEDASARGFVPYLSSQYLMDSSLSQDVSQFDFSTPVQAYSSVSSSAEGRGENVLAPTRRRGSEENEESDDDIPEDVLEMDELNRHECMPVLVSLLKHMKEAGVYKHPQEGKEAAEMPTWMSCLHKKMSSSETATNVRLFILKLIINDPKIFEPFGKFWFSTITQFIISGKIKGAVLNYFIIDAIVVMLSWSSTCIPEDSVVGRNLASSLLDVLVKHCHHNNRAVLKNNLQVIKTLTKVWKDRVEIPYHYIYENFAIADVNTKDNMTGIQLLGVIITNGFAPFESRSGIDEERYFATLTRNLGFKYKDVYASVAEVIGLAMKFTAEKDKSVNSPLFSYTYERLLDLNTSNMDRFVMCLHRIQLNYPRMVDRFVSQLLFILPSLHGILKQQCLETLASAAENFEEPNDVFIELKNKGLDSALDHRDEGVQMAALNVFNGLLKNLSAAQILPFLQTISKLSSHTSVALRESMYEMFMWIYDIYRADESDEMKDEGSFDVLKISKEVLLLGINDCNTEISLKVLNFWRHETRLPESTIERLIEILRALYSIKTEKEYLSYSTNLLLQLTSLSPDYTLPMFNEPLDSTKRFQEYSVNFSWQRQKVAMTPLFAATMNQSQTSSQSQGASSLGTGMLRATQQNIEFTPTQEPGSSVNWMNPSFQVGSLPSQQTQTPASQSALLFATRKENRRTDFNKGTLRLSHGDGSTKDGKDIVDGVKDERSDILRLKRRFIKSQEQSMYFAIRERKSQQLRQSVFQRQKAARDHKVVMYRNYRAGELPDIQIKHSELIVPLQALAQHDSMLARQLFGVLLDAIIRELPDKLSEDVMEKACTDIQAALDMMINSSVAFHPPFVYALEDACVRQNRLKLDAISVATASSASLQQPIGIVLLEKQILQNLNHEPDSKKSRGYQSDDVCTWIETAKLYKSIEQYDFVHCIFSEQVTKLESTKLALEAEDRNDYAEALKLYNQVLTVEDWNGNEPSSEEQEFWDIARLECYNNLGQWSHLKSLTLQSIDEDSPADITKIWDDAYLQEQFLPFYLRSNVKLLCQGKVESGEKDFSLFIEESLRADDRRAILESRFSDELALIRIMQDNFGAAEHYISLSMQSFVEEWSNLSLLMTNIRLRALSRLQRLYEMKEFTDLFSNNEELTLENIGKMLEKWSKRLPDKTLHAVSVWDDVITNRCVYMRKIKQRCKDRSSHHLEAVSERLDMEQSKNMLLLADLARHQGNFAVAAQYLRDSYDSTLQMKAKENGLAVDWYHLYARVHCDKTGKSNPTDAVSSLVTVLKKLDEVKKFATTDAKKNISHYILESSTWNCLADVISTQDEKEIRNLLGQKQLSCLANIYGACPPLEKDKCQLFLEQYSYSCLQSAVAKSHQLDETVADNRLLLENALMTMVKFCDKSLRASEADNNESPAHYEYAHIVVRHMLKSMTLDSKEARQRFPRLLQIIGRYPETRETFLRKTVNVPIWMFLSWLNQMVALLDKDEASAVFPVLNSIAKEYPQALIHPLRISSEQYKFGSDSQGRKNRDNFKKLLAETSYPIWDDFIAALEQFTNPHLLFKDWVSDMKQLLAVKRRDVEAIKACYLVIWKKLFEPQNRHEKIRGKIRRKCAIEFSKQAETAFGEYGAKIPDMTMKEFTKSWSNILKNLKEMKFEQGNLENYSPWFSSFQNDAQAVLMEIPGQYTGKQKPLVEYHVKIAGFDQKVLMMPSLRQPKRLKIRGDDEKEYKFLVKGGEDLRLDQRIEQLFGIMNGILTEDSICSSKALTLKTYQVIPLTTRIGIIEWLDNTSPLKDLVRVDPKISETLRKHYQDFQKRYLKNPNVEVYKYYEEVYRLANRTDTVKSFEQRQRNLPWDLLRRSFDKISTSKEAYFMLRNHFIHTHSCLSACHYILGIGDRHLDNLLLDCKTGGIIGIDFGYSFGSGTTSLAVPELMPFRLTRQFVNLLMPLENAGPYRLTMAAVLRALRKDSELLLTTMDVFVNEPLVDWQINARKQMVKMDSTDESDAWYPKEKILICKQKLKGINSAYITGEELRLGKGKSSSFQSMLRVVHGDAKHNVRRKYMEEAERAVGCNDYRLTPEQQAECLIDQATDPNILGRTWTGWEPWV